MSGLAHPDAALDAPSPKFALRPFLASAGLLSSSSLVNLARGLITAKVLAITLGPSLVGVLAQVLNLSVLLMNIVPLGLTVGVTRLVARSLADRRRTDLLVFNSVGLGLVSAAVACLLLLPFSTSIASSVVGGAQYSPLVIMTLLALPAGNVAGILGYVIQGIGNLRLYTAANISSAAIAGGLVVPAAILFGITGVVAAILLATTAQAILFAVAALLAYRGSGWRLSHLSVSSGIIRELLTGGGVLLTAGIAVWGSTLIVRTLAIRTLGDFANGIYQVTFTFSLQYMAVFLTWMGAYVLPRLAAETNVASLRGLANSSLRNNLLIMVPLLAAVIALRQPLIHLVYTASFLAAGDLVPVQALGDYIRVIGGPFVYLLLARAANRPYLVAILAQCVLWIVFTALAVRPLGIPAVALGYALSSVAWPAVGYIVARQRFQAWIDRESMILFALGTAVLAGAIMAPLVIGMLLIPVLPLALLGLHRFRQERASPAP